MDKKNRSLMIINLFSFLLIMGTHVLSTRCSEYELIPIATLHSDARITWVGSTSSDKDMPEGITEYCHNSINLPDTFLTKQASQTVYRYMDSKKTPHLFTLFKADKRKVLVPLLTLLSNQSNVIDVLLVENSNMGISSRLYIPKNNLEDNKQSNTLPSKRSLVIRAIVGFCLTTALFYWLYSIRYSSQH